MNTKKYKVHFTPERGWMNDPNGLIYVDGQYHLFYQHYPDETKWGPMHWGHAVSLDLINWEYLPIALYPTKEEYIFSGSAILDYENGSGLRRGEKPTMLVYYTGHNPLTREQVQCLAYSNDYVHFTKYSGNPIITNTFGSIDYKQDFRDPKIIRNEITGGYTMLLVAGDRVEFYESDNLTTWQYTGDFVPGMFGYGGICECPDMYTLNCEGVTKYILTMSVVFLEEGAALETHLQQYFVGDFDGERFVNTQPFSERQLLDFGPDNYASVTFAECEDRIMIGWGEDWNLARDNEEPEIFGKMTLARRLNLVKKGEEFLLCQTPVIGVCPDDNMRREILIKNGETQVVFGRITVSNCDSVLKINGRTIERTMDGDCQVHAFRDADFYELFADEGTIAYSINEKELKKFEGN